MFNIGFGEILVIVVLGLLVFGPDRLPGAVRRGTELVAALRTAATAARQQIAEASGMDDQETGRVLEDLRDLHPRRIASSVLAPAPQPKPNTDPGGSAASPAPPTGLDPDLT